MAEMPEMDPAELISAEAAKLAEKLGKIARQAVEDALSQSAVASAADVLNILEGLVQTLPPALAAALEAELPKITAQAVIAAEVEIADAREQSGKPFPNVAPPPAGDYSGWTLTAVTSLIASIRKKVEVAGAVPAAPVEGVSAEVLAELDADISAALDELFGTASARSVNAARMAVFAANSDVVSKVRVVTVKDTKRSEICTHMNGAEFDPSRPVPTPPYHNGCRSYLKAVTTAKRKAGATDAEIYRQNWAIYRRLEREAKAQAEGRALEHLEVRFAPDPSAGTFSGYAVTWNELDGHKTAFAPGALNLPDAGLPLLWSHDPTKPVGSITEARADSRGLFIKGKLTTDSSAGAEAYSLVKDKAVTGLSIGFRRLKDEAMPGGRRITAADLKEVSLVALPSNESARITEVRSAPDAAPDCSHHHHTKEAVMAEKTPAPGEGAEETRQDVTAEVRGALDALTKRLDRIEARAGRAGLGGGDQSAEGDLECRAFTSFIRRGAERAGADEIRSLRVSDDSQGGFLAPEQFIAELLKNVTLFSPIRSVARVANTAAQAVLLPKRTGRLTASWVGEVDQRPETSPTYGQARYPVYEAACYVDASNAMLEDGALDVAAELSADFGEEFGKLEGTAFLNGTGSLQPAGLMNDAGINFTVSGHASQITAEGLIQAFHDLPSPYRAGSVWAMNSQTLGTIRKLKDPTTGAFLLMTSGIANAPATTLLGAPVIECPDLDDVGAGKFPVVLGDWSNFRIFDRIALSVLRDPYSIATTGQTRFHARRRLAAGVAKQEAFRKLKIAAS